jgi:hypothetical protein
MINAVLALTLLVVLIGGFNLSTPAASAGERPGSFDASQNRHAPAVLPSASEVEKDAAQAATEIEASKQADRGIRGDEAHPSRRPDLHPDDLRA